MQAGLVCHHTTAEGRTSYEANPRNAYYIVRSGRVLEVVQKRYGRAATAIVIQLLLLGHASIAQLKRAVRTLDENNTQEEEAGYDGIEVDNTLRILCKHGLVCRLRQAYFRTEADTRLLAEEKVYGLPTTSTAKGTKAKEEMATKIEEEILKQVDTHITLLKPPLSSALSQKRKFVDLDESGPNSKRLKLTNGVTHEAGSEAEPSTDSTGDDVNQIVDSLVVRLNCARITVLFRNTRLSNLVSDTYGRSVSRTYEALLKQLEPDISDAIDDASLGPEKERPPDISPEIDENQLAEALAHPEIDNEHLDSRWTGVNGHMNGNTHWLTPETRTHLEILCEQPFRFLFHSMEYPDKYVVHYSDLSIHLRNADILRIISARFDKYSVRVIRVLMEKGKMDEKHLQGIVLMSAKELRQNLAMLKQAGFLELQEVPREAQRQPSRTMYLWFYDPDRVRKMLIEDTYKCMARCLQRMKVEREKIKPTIEKSERSDVRGQEEKLLAKAELDVLKAWRRKEEWLLGEVGRLDELVFVLRDF